MLTGLACQVAQSMLTLSTGGLHLGRLGGCDLGGLGLRHLSSGLRLHLLLLLRLLNLLLLLGSANSLFSRGEREKRDVVCL